jgi:beta-galactosidase
MPGYGSALPHAQHRRDAETIKGMGLNAVRLAHYPQHPAFLDACDELGILVYAEIATWKSVTTGKWLDAAERQLRGMILRDRHHPSIILWGLGNESRSRAAYERLGDIAHELDPDRFTIYAENHLYRAKRENALNLVDVWGCNYELDVLDEVPDYCATGVALVSECSNSPHAVRGDTAMEQDQVERITRDLDTIAAHPACAGFFIWSFQDYATLRKKRYIRHCGLVDAWREPKKAALMLKERFGDKPSPS